MSIAQNYPNVAPQLLIDLANTQRLDPRLTFARASVGTYYDENGVLQTAPSGVARFQFDPVTGESLGLLRENQATNLVTYSEDFSDSSWVKNNVTVTSNTVIAPDGMLTSDKVALNSGVSVAPANSAFKNLSVLTGVYTASIYAKKAEFSVLQMAIRAADNSTKSGPQFDLSAGTVGALNNAISATIAPVGNGWYRCTTTFDFLTGVTAARMYYISAQQTGDGYSGIYIWGAQVELGSIRTSYIKTEASQVTRAADTVTLTNVDAYNTAEFTAVSSPFGVSSVSANTVTLNGDVPIERLYVYPRNISQNEINSVVENDGWWNWRIVGSDFALPNFGTDGTVIVDWGDGTVETLTTAVHTFTNASPHTVRFRQMTGTYFSPIINNNATYKNMVVAVGSAPSNMIADCNSGFRGCINLKSFDATLIGGSSFINSWLSCTSLTSFPLIDTSSGTNFTSTWYNCSGLTSFPLIDTSAGTNFTQTWLSCTSLTSFPLIDTSAGTNFAGTWYNCNSLTSFPLIDTSAGTNFAEAWHLCNSLTSFPAIDTSSGTNFTSTWRSCTSLTSFPALNMSSGTNFSTTFRDCSSLISFPLINMNLGTNFTTCWFGCSSMTDFPANFFDSWTGTPLSNCFYLTWDNCSALTATSVENILVSIDTSGQSPTGGTEITIDYNVATGALTAPTTSAITSLKGKGWTIKINGVLQ